MKETKSSRPDISIIIPTRNRKDFLMVAVQSVLQQTYKNLEVIVHDNNSTDGTEAELQRRFTDYRIRYYRVNNDLTMQQNWNTAFQYVTGRYFLRLDDDNCLYNGFLERVLREMQQQHLSVMTFSALTVHLRNRLLSVFDEEERTHVLTKYQIAYLEYFCLTDSNCTVYDVAMLNRMFPDGNIYQADLPDRYLSYCIAGRMDELGSRVGFSTVVQDVTRYDYRSYLPPGFRLAYVPYMTDQMKDADPKKYSFNFALYRVNTLKKFMGETSYRDIQNFFEKQVMSRQAYRALVFWGHITRTRSAYSLKELGVYLRCVFAITTCLLRRSWVVIEGERAVVFLIKFGGVALKGIYHSLWSITRGEKRKPDEVDESLGKDIIATVLRGGTIDRHKIISLNGKLSNFLLRINKKAELYS
jgi:glycosyltransferase involved in cell wall biosynthesis